MNKKMFSISGKRIVRFLTHFQQPLGGSARVASYKSARRAAAAGILLNDLEKASSAATSVKNAPREVDLSLFKMLVAEDNIINQKLLQKMLQQMDIRYKIVGDGLAAIEALRNEHFDFVLMDCYMPEVSGFETATQIRASKERFSSIPIIAFSAGMLGDEVRHSGELGMNDFLMKPVSVDQLRAKILQWAHFVHEQTPILDTSSLDKIRHFDDQNQSLLRSLYEIYAENTLDELYILRDLIADGAFELARRKAHMLKSSAAQLGALRFEKYCILMEYEDVLDSARANKIFSRMFTEYESSRSLFAKYCQSLSQKLNVLM